MSLETSIKASIKDVIDFPKSGIIFKDITPIFENPSLCNQIVDGFINSLQSKPDAIVGIESRGFLFGFLLANRLEIPFVLARKKGKLPGKLISNTYKLEYGEATIEMQVDSLKENWNVLIHDDALATGGTAEAVANLVKEQKANIGGFSFLIELTALNGKEKLTKYSKNITCLAQY